MDSPPPTPNVPIPLWQKVLIGFAALLFLGICTAIMGSEPESPPEAETPLVKTPELATATATAVPPAEPQLTGQEIFTCLLNTKTPISERVVCEYQREIATMNAVFMTHWETSDLPPVQRAELERAINMADTLHSSIEQLMGQSPAPHILCQGPLADYRDTFLTLRDYRDSNTDLEVIYLDYRLASAGYFIQKLDEHCSEVGLPLPPPKQ